MEHRGRLRVGARTANECLFNYVSSSLFIAGNAPHPFLFSFLRYAAGGSGDYADAAAGKIGAVLFTRCVAGGEGEGKDVETERCAKSLMRLPTACVIWSRRSREQ